VSSLALLTSIDGKITRASEAVLPMPDDGLLRGDGVFEVLRCYSGTPFALREHLDRLERSAKAIGLEVARQEIESEVAALIERAGTPDCLLRIIVTRSGRRIISIENLLIHPSSISLATVTYTPTVILNGVKSLSYAANMEATRIAKRAGAAEALLVTPEGIVLEAPTSTLFWVSEEGPLRTTATEAGVLDSITRAKIIERCEVELGSFPLRDVMNATEAFLASTTREVQPVETIDGHKIPTYPAPRTLEAAAALQDALNEALR